METFKIMAVNRHRIKTDGNGVTTLVGLYGCPLQCKYCLNKEILKTDIYEEVTPEELWNKLQIDYCYFVATGGGITFGGGESLLYYKAIKELKEIIPSNVKINIETSLNVDNHILVDIINDVDELIIDIKTLNPLVYKQYTDRGIYNLVNNLDYIVKNGYQDKCHIRIPYIENFTTKSDVLKDIERIKQLGFNKIDTFDYILK